MRRFGLIVALLALVLSVATAAGSVWYRAAASEPHFTAEVCEGGVCEVLADFGEVERSALSHRIIRLENSTDEPLALLDYRATCKCVWLTLPTKAIPAGGYADVTITYDSRGEWGSVGNYISIESSNQSCKIAVWMAAEIQ